MKKAAKTKSRKNDFEESAEWEQLKEQLHGMRKLVSFQLTLIGEMEKRVAKLAKKQDPQSKS